MTDEFPASYYWLRDDILARRLGGCARRCGAVATGPGARTWDTNLAVEGTPISEQEAERRLLARGETSPFSQRLGAQQGARAPGAHG